MLASSSSQHLESHQTPQGNPPVDSNKHGHALGPKDWIELARRYAAYYRDQGYVVDVAVHDDGTGNNPHVHMLLTTRQITPAGFGPKRREMDRAAFVGEARRLWEELANTTLDGRNLPPIDRRSHRERGLKETPGRHRGPSPKRERQREMGSSHTQEKTTMPQPPKEDRPAAADDTKAAGDRPWWRDRQEVPERNGDGSTSYWWEEQPERNDPALSDAERAEYEAHLDERGAMRPDPEPDPDGRPTSPKELRDAERRMLADLEAEPDERSPE